MNTTRVITAVCWVIAAFVLIGLAIWFVFGLTGFLGSSEIRSGWITSWFRTETGPYEAAGTSSTGTQDVDSINIDWISGDVTVKPHDGAYIEVTEYARRELRDDEKMQVSLSVSDRTLTIRHHSRGTGIMRITPSKRVEVLIPQALIENLTSFEVDTTSADVSLEGIGASELYIDTTSGNVGISGITVQELEIDTTSGDMNIQTTSADNITANSTSGDIRITKSSARELYCDTTSGDIDISGAFDRVETDSTSGSFTLDNSAPGSVVNADTSSGELKLSGNFHSAVLETISGSINMTSTTLPSALRARSTSGDITINVPEGEGEISVRYSTTSGRFSTDLPTKVQDNDARFNLSTTSGDIRIVASGSE